MPLTVAMSDRSAPRNAAAHGRTWRTLLPPAPHWGQSPGLPADRILRPLPQARGSSPVPAVTQASGWENVPPHWTSPSSRWTYDAHPEYSGWDASAVGHAAALLLNAAVSILSQVYNVN